MSDSLSLSLLLDLLHVSSSSETTERESFDDLVIFVDCNVERTQLSSSLSTLLSEEIIEEDTVDRGDWNNSLRVVVPSLLLLL